MSSAVINRRRFLELTACAAWPASVLGRAAAGRQAPRRRPNIVFILADDLGWADVGCNGATSFYETPNIDRLAAEGIRFTEAYAACPVCSPTRASILTGKYPARLNLTDWIPGRQADGARPNERLIGPRFLQQLPLEEVTLAEALKEGGYATGLVGKWHLGNERYYPEYQGFDVNVGGNSYGHPLGGYFSPYKNPKLPDGPKGEYLTDRLADEAVAFMRAHRDAPFFLYLTHYAPHNPQQARKELVGKYEAKAGALTSSTRPHFVKDGGVETRQVQDHAVYAAMLQSLDESVGRVARELDALGLARDTCVIFMSDNGGLSTAEGSPTSNLPLRAGKGWLYEGGIREPLIVRWPGVVRAGASCEEPVTSTDFYPTILDLAGLPPLPRQHVDGTSFATLLRGAGRLDRKAIYWHYPHYSNQWGRPGGAVRSGNFKLIEFYEDWRIELYDLNDDVGERHDLAAKLPEKAAGLRAMLHEWRKAVGARMPEPNPAFRPPA